MNFYLLSTRKLGRTAFSCLPSPLAPRSVVPAAKADPEAEAESKAESKAESEAEFEADSNQEPRGRRSSLNRGRSASSPTSSGNEDGDEEEEEGAEFEDAAPSPKKARRQCLFVSWGARCEETAEANCDFCKKHEK